MQYVVLFIGIGTLLAGIIGISNIMVFVVKERTKELGIRKAIGATPKSIVGMILQESVFITAIAGYAGLLAGVGTLALIGDSLEDYFITNPYIDTSEAVGATVILVVFGAIAGYIPLARGRIIWRGQDITLSAPGNRPIAMLFQDNNHLSTFFALT